MNKLNLSSDDTARLSKRIAGVVDSILLSGEESVFEKLHEQVRRELISELFQGVRPGQWLWILSRKPILDECPHCRGTKTLNIEHINLKTGVMDIAEGECPFCNGSGKVEAGTEARIECVEIASLTVTLSSDFSEDTVSPLCVQAHYYDRQGDERIVELDFSNDATSDLTGVYRTASDAEAALERLRSR